MFFIEQSRIEIIQVFMEEAKQKHVGLRAGYKPEYKFDIGLVEVSVAFESFLHIISNKQYVSQRIHDFSTEGELTPSINKIKSAMKQYILNLKKELDVEQLQDMTPNSIRPPLIISDIEDIKSILSVVYRVRSNLVHGSKALSSSRNKILIENSFHLLYVLMEQICKDKNIIS